MIKQNTALLQNWLRTVIMAPGYLQQKIGLANHVHNLNEHDVVADGGTAPTYARLNVYSSGYMLRLLDCMYADYPVFKKFIGDEVFDSFAKAYLLYHPSTSFTLYDLGKAFPDFLARTRPAANADNDDTYLDIPACLARVERARQQAMRAKGTEDDNNSIDINLQDILFSPVNIDVPACLQLLELSFPMKQFFASVYRDEVYELPLPQKTYMAISRKNYRLVIEEVSEAQYLLLTALQTQPNLYQAIGRVTANTGIVFSDVLADVYLWLPYFKNCGFI